MPVDPRGASGRLDSMRTPGLHPRAGTWVALRRGCGSLYSLSSEGDNNRLPYKQDAHVLRCNWSGWEWAVITFKKITISFRRVVKTWRLLWSRQNLSWYLPPRRNDGAHSREHRARAAWDVKDRLGFRQSSESLLQLLVKFSKLLEHR